MGIAKLARSLGISEDEATQLRATYDRMLPDVKKFTFAAQHAAIQRGWVRTKLHRRRRFPQKEYAYKAGNAVIQGTSADMTKLKMVEIDRYFTQAGAESALMLQVHDELDWTLGPDEDTLDMGARAIMESFGEHDKMQFTVPMKVEQTLGDDWGRASFPDWKGVDGQ
jgi:DNA polymerase-1